MAKAAPSQDGRRANRRGAARLAAVQALYQMDLAATPLNDILGQFEAFWIGREVEGIEFKRGIVRKLPGSFEDHNGREIEVQYAIIAVQQNGATAPYHTATEGGDLVVYVGEKNTLL